MLKVTFNKPAVDQHISGAGTTIRGLEVRLQDGKIAFAPRRTARDTKTHQNIVAIEQRKRSSIQIVFEGSMLDEVVDCLRNPNGNPFFLLQREGEWIIPVPYADQRMYIGKRSEPTRMTPHMRVWSADLQRGMAPYMMPQTRQTSEFVGDILMAVKTIQDFYSRDTFGRPSTAVTNAFAMLQTYETMSNLFFPGLNSQIFSRKNIDPSVGRHLLSMNLEALTQSLPEKAFIPIPFERFKGSLNGKGLKHA